MEGTRNSKRTGTPPRAWGKQKGEVLDLLESRYTPTCVGKTDGQPWLQTPITVHPHVRGENAVAGFLATSLGGTPPRAWGKQEEVEEGPLADRYTPTCVGKTGFGVFVVRQG